MWLSMRNKTNAFIISTWLTMALFIAFVTAVFFYIMAEKHVNHTNDLRHKSYLLANELRQSSHDLTKMARTFAITGDPRYKQYYQEILDIRDGKRPRPSNYQATYWDLVIANKAPKTNGAEVKIALVNLMTDVGFTEDELEQFYLAKKNSDLITETELNAINILTNAKSELGPQYKSAINILTNDNYINAKANVMEPINTLYNLMDKRTQTALNQAERIAGILRIALLALGLSFIFMLWRINQAMRITLGGTADEIYQHIKRIGAGDFATPITLAEGQKNSVLGWLAETQRSLQQLRQDRLHMESAKQASDERYRTLFNHAHIGIVIFHGDPKRTFLDGNNFLCNMLGYSLDELLSLYPANIVTEAEVEHIIPAMDLILAKASYAREWQFQRKDGSTFPADVIATTMPDGTMMAMIRDITQRKHAEEQLRSSEENLSITLQSIGDAVIATDTQGNITRMNPAAEHLTGWPLAEALGQPLNSVFHIINAETREPARNPAELVMEHGNVVGLANHTALIARDGSEYQISDSAAPIRDSKGKIVGVVLVFSDVTEKYLALEALHRADERFRRTFKLMPNPLTLQTPDGVLLDCSEAFCESTGYSRDEIIGRNIKDFNLWVDPDKRFAMRDTLIRDKKIDNFEFELRRRNGEIRTIEFSARFLTAEPEPILLAVAYDITTRKQAEEALRLSELRLRTIIDTEPECVKVVGDKGELLEMNAAGLAMLEARSVEEVKAKKLVNFILPSYRAAFIDLHRRVMAGENATLAFEVAGLKGTHRWLETHATPLRDTETGAINKLLGVTRDITERRRAELALQESALHTQAILDNMFDGVITINTKGTIESFNKAASHIFGYPQDEVLGGNITKLMPAHYKHQHENHLKAHEGNLNGQELNILREVEGQRKDGEVFPMSLSITKILRAGKTTFVGVIRDISQQRRDEEEIYRLAFYDPLTNLPNRRLLYDRLQQAIHTSCRTDQHGALMFLDLDHFKQLNDSLGHDVGDILLQQVALRLQACVREGDSVARMGGDEFVMLIEALSVYPNEAASQAEMIADKVLASLAQPYHLREHTYVITPSIGIVVFLHQEETFDELLKKADVAMYQAKTAGRNNARFFDPTMQAAVSVRVELEKSMRLALERDEFLLHYQFQVDSQGTPTGVEALVRWHHPKHGMISPASFIPLAEETGMILALGQWVLETACAQLVEWSKAPETANWTMAVNVSISQFAQPTFVANVDHALQKTGANPHRLKLELTESILAKDVDDVIVKMFEIKALGVTFSLDDFGTGYSSLSYLKRLPLDQLKIDQSFVRDLLSDANDAAIARTIIALGHSLSLSVIAEGVETLEQRNALAEMGCDAYQGYYFARPVAVSDFAQTMNKIPRLDV
jgi:diguanylate cyclase (GGDEF)-like protein/PAS domain S-box-containing protein